MWATLNFIMAVVQFLLAITLPELSGFYLAVGLFNLGVGVYCYVNGT